MSGTTTSNTGAGDAQSGYPNQANTAVTTDGFKKTGAQDETTQKPGEATAEEGLETVEGQEGADPATLDPKKQQQQQQQQGGKLSSMLGRLTKGSDKAAEGQEGSSKK